MMRYPPCDSTTLRQPSDRFGLFARRQAFICGGLPICSAQNFPASERQAICSCGVGPDCAKTCWVKTCCAETCCAKTGAPDVNSNSSETEADETQASFR